MKKIPIKENKLLITSINNIINHKTDGVIILYKI